MTTMDDPDDDARDGDGVGGQGPAADRGGAETPAGAHPPEAGRDAAPEAARGAGGTLRTVLLVEDQWLIAMDLSDQIEEGGYRTVGPAATVESALALIESERIDAALLDIDLGGVPSYPVAEAMRARGIAFAFLSGHSSAEIDPAFAGQRLLCKPVVPQQLVATLREMLAQR